MRPSATFHIRLCGSLGFSQAGHRSARLAVLAYRIGVRTHYLIKAGRSWDFMLRRLQAINAAYLSALSAERETMR